MLTRGWFGALRPNATTIVTEIKGEVNYQLQLDEKGKLRVFHHDKLKRYQGNCPPKWLTKVAAALKRNAGTKANAYTQTEA